MIVLSGPPSFSSNLQQAPMNPSLGSPNDLGLVPNHQQPPKPIMSPANPPPPSNNTEFQASYHGTELVMLYDYKVRETFEKSSNFLLLFATNNRLKLLMI